MSEDQIKSKQRVKDLAEVLTAPREINGMLALIDEFTATHHIQKQKLSYRIDSRFLEPACGNGNFLVEILARKLETVANKSQDTPKNLTETQFLLFQSFASIYGIDIDSANVIEAKERLIKFARDYSINLGTNFFQAFLGVEEILKEIVERNIILGDSLQEKSEITLIDYQYPRQNYVSFALWTLADIEQKNKEEKINKKRTKMFYFMDYLSHIGGRFDGINRTR